MRWIKFDASANGIFSREVCPEDSDYLHSHMDTFKCMWHEQTRNYWVRMVVSLREYVRKNIFTEECLERLGAPMELFELVIDCAYVNICSSFTQESFGKAKEFLLASINVTANRDMIANVGMRPISNDPFFNKCTRDFYRTVFGPPTSTVKTQLQANLTAPLYARFAAGVVAVLKEWVQTPDCSLKHFVTKFHKEPYWSYPSDFCPQKTVFKFLDDNCGGWDTPEYPEVQEVMLKAPDRATEFADTVDYLTKALAEHGGDFHLGDYRDGEDSDEGVAAHGVKFWTDILFGVCEQLDLTAPYHLEEFCIDCLAASDYEWSDCSDDSFALSGDDEFDPDDPEHVHSDHAFWCQPRVVALLNAAEKKYKESMASKNFGIHININIGGGLTGLGANPPRKARRQPRKMPPQAGVVTNGTTANASKAKPAKETTANTGKAKATNGTPNAAKPKVTSKSGAASKPNSAKAGAARPTINLEDSTEKSAEVAAALERLKLNIGTPPAPQQPPAGQKPQAAKVDNKSSANGSSAAAAPKVQGRKCANCGKSDGVKLKKCSLCVQKKMEPAFYCSRECQMEDWENHEVVHADDLD